MNFTQSKFYVEQLLQADPDSVSFLAIEVANWFLSECENSLEGTPEDEHDLHLMSAPLGCASFLTCVAEGLVVLSDAIEGDTYNNEFDWPDDREPVGGVMQAYNIAHICMTDHELTPDEFKQAARQMSLIMLGIADAITTDDRRSFAVSIVGTVSDEVPESVQRQLSDAILLLFASHGIELESTLINFTQPSDGKGQHNVIIE